MHPSCWQSAGSNRLGCHLEETLHCGIWTRVCRDPMVLKIQAASKAIKEQDEKNQDMYCRTIR